MSSERFPVISFLVVVGSLATLGGCAVIELAQDNGNVTMEVLNEPAQK